jgi:predicted ATP-dependent serine protease
VAAALASAVTGKAPPPGRAFVGELALTGALRPVPSIEARLSAAASAGMTEAVIPRNGPTPAERGSGLRLIRAAHLREALAWSGSDRRSMGPRPAE